MAAQIWIGSRSRSAYLRRLSVVYAVELRLRIVTELYLREMSPKGFFEEFGGGSISRVDSNFKMLVRYGWLRYIRSETGGARRGGVEHFYRATEPAVFDHETWSLLPYSVRVAFSWTSFKQYAEKVREAMVAGTFDSRPERRRACESLLLDELGWRRVIRAVDRTFVSLFEEQADARLRIFRSGESPVLATVALIAFESPLVGGLRVGPILVEGPESPVPFSARFSKVIADETCLKIVDEGNLDEVSATTFHSAFGGDVDGIRRRFKMLERTDWQRMTSERTGGRRRGATEKFYRATGPALLGGNPWTGAPESIRGESSWAVFERLSELALEAMRAGTFDIRRDRYLTWSLLRLDQRGWEEVTASIDRLLAFVLEEQERARIRIERSDEQPVRMTVGLAGFESPEPPREP